MYTLDQLRCFVAVAEHLHFSRAAEELSMTQPPLSRQIQKLEKSLGVELLHRSRRSVQLTAAGQVFLRDSRSILGAVDRAGEHALSAASGMEGQISIGFTAASGLSTLGQVLELVKGEMPRVEVELHEMVTARQIEALEDGRIDVGLGRLAESSGDLVTTPVHSEALVLAAPDGHPLLSSRNLHREDLAGVPLILHSPSSARYFYDLIVRNFDIDHRDVVHSLSQVATMVSLVASGHGVALVPESVGVLNIHGVGYRAFDDLRRDIVQLQLILPAGSRNPAAEKLQELVAEGLLPTAPQ